MPCFFKIKRLYLPLLNFNPFLMKKLLFLTAALTAALWANATTDNEHICVSSGGLITNDLCLPMDGSVSVTFGSIPDLTYFRWIPLGDLEFADGSSARDTTVTIVSNGYGKGTIRLQYRNGGCTSASTVDVFKSFTLPDTFAIAGPTCIAPGDVVVYSVDPILTVNLDHNIGMDNYYWNVNENKPSFVDSIYYTAGDGSSITFKVGTLTGNDVLSVGIGRCNKAEESKRISLTLGKLAPKPVLPTDTCVAYGTTPFTLAVQNAVEGVTYTWEAPSNFTLSSVCGSSVTVTPDNSSSGEIKVTASYTDEMACSESSSNITINRTWGATTSISCNTSCAKVASGQYYTFRLEGQIPTNTSIRWQLPVGWGFKPNTAENGQTIEARPFANASLSGVVKAWSLSCPSATAQNDTVAYTVHVTPAAIEEIYGEECLKIGKTYKFWIDTTGVRPAARKYVWTAPGCNLTAYTGDTVYITPTSATTYLRVTPQGDGCNAAYAQRNLSFSPTAPSAITMTGTSCIASNMPDTVTFSLSGTISNQTYDWVLPTGWELLSTNAAQTQMSVRTNGVAGTHTVSAFAIGTSTCGNSDTISFSTDIPTYATSIGYSLMFTMNVYGINNTSGKTISTVNWTFLQNNEIVVDALSSTTGNMVYLTDNYASIGDIQNSSIYTIVAMITFTDGCCVRLTYGAETEFANFQEAAMAPLSIKRVTNRSDELQISPNPSSSEITIEIGSQTNKIATIAIANMSGRIVKQHENFCIGQKLNIAELPDGQYLLCVQIDGKKSIEKFIKK